MSLFSKLGFRKTKLVDKELKVVHEILSVFYDRKKPTPTQLNDALYLRMKVKEVLDNRGDWNGIV